jgi:predicted Zn-dependent protease with MMP-like domain
LVRQAYQQVPPPVQKAIRNVDISVEEWPDAEQLDLADGGEVTLFGLYTGVPLPERYGGQPELPDRIIIYRQPILRSCSTRADAAREIQVTLWHEVGHYLGMDEDDLHRLGYG